MTNKDDFRRTLQNIKDHAIKGLNQQNTFKFEDILEEILEYEPEDSIYDLKGVEQDSE